MSAAINEPDTTQPKVLERRPARPRCFFDISIGKDATQLKPDDQIYRIIFELYADICPLTCENFRCLCTGEKGNSSTGKQLCYKNSIYHRVVKNFMIQGGDIILNNGKSGESIYGKTFKDENFEIKHDRPFILSMANKGKDTNSSQFFITTVPSPHLDQKHVAFGHVISGQSAISVIENLPTDEVGKPALTVTIVKCGELVLQVKPKDVQIAQSMAAKADASPKSGGEISDEEKMDNHDRSVKDHLQMQAEDDKIMFAEGEEDTKNKAPEIPKNYLLRGGYETCKKSEQVVAFDSTAGILAQLSSTHASSETGEGEINAAKVKALSSLLSSHVPNFKDLMQNVQDGDKDSMELLAQKAKQAMSSSRDHRSSRHERSSRSREKDRRKDVYNSRDYKDDRFYDHRREDRRGRRNDEETSYRSSKVTYVSNASRHKKRIPAHILQMVRHAQQALSRSTRDKSRSPRSKSRTPTPPHWKEAERRLIKLEDLIKAEQKKALKKGRTDKDDDDEADNKENVASGLLTSSHKRKSDRATPIADRLGFRKRRISSDEVKDRIGMDGQETMDLAPDDEEEIINPKSEIMAKAFWGPEGKRPSPVRTSYEYGPNQKGDISAKDWERYRLAAEMAKADQENGGLFLGPGANPNMNYTKPIIPDVSRFKKYGEDDSKYQHFGRYFYEGQSAQVDEEMPVAFAIHSQPSRHGQSRSHRDTDVSRHESERQGSRRGNETKRRENDNTKISKVTSQQNVQAKPGIINKPIARESDSRDKVVTSSGIIDENFTTSAMTDVDMIPLLDEQQQKLQDLMAARSTIGLKESKSSTNAVTSQHRGSSKRRVEDQSKSSRHGHHHDSHKDDGRHSHHHSHRRVSSRHDRHHDSHSSRHRRDDHRTRHGHGNRSDRHNERSGHYHHHRHVPSGSTHSGGGNKAPVSNINGEHSGRKVVPAVRGRKARSSSSSDSSTSTNSSASPAGRAINRKLVTAALAAASGQSGAK